MAKGYWISRIDVHDAARWAAYRELNAEAFRKYGGRFLVRGGSFENPEGAAKERNVVIEFPDYPSAIACFHSAEYARARAERLGAGDIDLVIIEGYDGPQP